eukprot:15497494-Heterocapsa_arctica.AAC.1
MAVWCAGGAPAPAASAPGRPTFTDRPASWPWRRAASTRAATRRGAGRRRRRRRRRRPGARPSTTPRSTRSSRPPRP